MYQIVIRNERPDFRVFIELLYDQNQNIDTDGDANPVYSRNWKELFIHKRDHIESSISIEIDELNKDIFKIYSDDQKLEEITALYLYEYCGNSIKKDDEILSDKKINKLKHKFHIELERAKKSIWHQSNKNNPYPNLKY